jgi:hypothetical protein
MLIEYYAERSPHGPNHCWRVWRKGRQGGLRIVTTYPDNTIGHKAAIEVASRLDQYAKFEV